MLLESSATSTFPTSNMILGNVNLQLVVGPVGKCYENYLEVASEAPVRIWITEQKTSRDIGSNVEYRK